MRKSQKLLSTFGVLAAPLVFSLLPVAVPKVGVVLAVILATNFFAFIIPTFLAVALVAVLLAASASGLTGGGRAFAIALF